MVKGVHDTDSEPLHVGESSDITNDMKQSVSTAFDEMDYSSSESSSKVCVEFNSGLAFHPDYLIILFCHIPFIVAG